LHSLRSHRYQLRGAIPFDELPDAIQRALKREGVCNDKGWAHHVFGKQAKGQPFVSAVTVLLSIYGATDISDEGRKDPEWQTRCEALGLDWKKVSKLTVGGKTDVTDKCRESCEWLALCERLGLDPKKASKWSVAGKGKALPIRAAKRLEKRQRELTSEGVPEMDASESKEFVSAEIGKYVNTSP
jgi:hypothetical protein